MLFFYLLKLYFDSHIRFLFFSIQYVYGLWQHNNILKDKQKNIYTYFSLFKIINIYITNNEI